MKVQQMMDPSWVTASATAILAAITAYYAWLNRKLLKEMRKERIGPIAEYVEKNLLTPFIQILDREINATSYDYKCNEIFQPIEVEFQTTEVNGIIDIYCYKERVFVDKLFKRRPKICQLMQEHNELVDNLREKLKQLFSSIYSDDFKHKVQQLIDEHNRSARQKIETTPEFFAIALTNSFIETWEGREHYYEFYKKHESLFKEFLKREGVKEKVEERDKICIKLKKKAGELKKELENVREKVVEEYLL